MYRRQPKKRRKTTHGRQHTGDKQQTANGIDDVVVLPQVIGMLRIDILVCGEKDGSSS
jgi:hypothetical protein